jgi:Astacin (Peptidase family M12A)
VQLFVDREQVNYIHQAAAYLESQTCLKFPRRTTESDFVFITGDSVGCAAVVGRRGGAQRIRLQPHSIESGCFRFFTIVHEFIHALGFHHMQNTFDRDNYIRINWENIRPESVDSFQLRTATEVEHFDVPYDIGSVMHYSPTAFSANGRETMTPIYNPKRRKMGQRREATPEDLLRINRMYNCPIKS